MGMAAAEIRLSWQSDEKGRSVNKRERVLNALNNRPVDHVPVGFWFHFSGEDATGERNVQAHLNYYRQTDLDFLKVMSDGFFNYPFNVEITKAHDWYGLEPLQPNDPWIKQQVERVRALVTAIGDERCVFYNVFAPLSYLRFGAEQAGRHFDRVVADLREDPNAVLHALDTIGVTASILARRVIEEAGADGVYYCVQNGEKGLFTPEEHRRWVRPSDLYVLEHANRYSDNNIVHFCGFAGKENQLELWQDYPGKAVNWAVHVDDLSLDDGRLFFGGRASLAGFETHWDANGHRGIIYSGTKEELQQYTRDLILDHGKHGLLLGGDCTIDAKLDWERIRWIVEAARSL